MSSKRVALIGAGRMGKCHAPNIAAHPALSFAYVVEPDATSAGQISQAFGATSVSFEHVLADPDVAGVFICTSTDQHLPQTLAALNAGKAVFCEKPIGLDLASVEQSRPPASSPPFLLAFNRRFDPHIRKLAETVQTGSIGQVESVRIVNHDPDCPPAHFIRDSGGIFLDFTIHDLDLAIWIMDDPISEVFATGSCLIDPAIADHGDFDTSRVILKTRRGKLCCISNTRRSGCGYDQRIEVFGSSGRAATDNLSPQALRTWGRAGEARPAIYRDFITRYAGSYRAETDHFANIMLGLENPLVSYDDGVDALRVALACKESALSGKPIKLQNTK